MSRVCAIDTVEISQLVAGHGRRLLAWALDTAFSGLLVIPVAPLILDEDRPRLALTIAIGALGVAALVLLALFDAGQHGATPGKRLIGIRVVDLDTGGRIGLQRAALRRAVYAVGGLALCLGWLWALLDPRHRTWHDKAAGTLVIRTD